MAEDRFGNKIDPLAPADPINDPARPIDPSDPAYTRIEDRDYGRSNAAVGWIVGAVVVLGVLVYAFGWNSDSNTDTASNPTPVTTGQLNSPPATPGPIPANPPAAIPAPADSAPANPSTTGSAPAQ